jgi:hypothetical protein
VDKTSARDAISPFVGSRLVTDRDGATDPIVLDETLLLRPGRDDDVRAKPPHLETALRI